MKEPALLALLVVLASCQPVPPPAPPPLPAVPAELTSCPEGAMRPEPVATPRTVEALSRWALATERARWQTELARRECARRLAALNAWIAAQRQR